MSEKTCNRFGGWQFGNAQWHREFQLKVLSQNSTRWFSTLMGIDSGCISEDTSNVPPLNIQSPSPCTSLFSMTSNFVWSQGGLGGLIVLFFNLPFQICTSQCTKVERSNVSCKASGQFWPMHRGATKFPSVQIPSLPLLSFIQGEKRNPGLVSQRVFNNSFYKSLLEQRFKQVNKQ